MRRKITEQKIEIPDLPEISEADDIFAQECAKGKTAIEALKTSRDCSGMGINTQYSYASKLRNDYKIAIRIAAYQKACLGVAVESMEEHIRGMYRLREIALETGNIGAAVQAHHFADKASGHYVDQVRDVTVDPLNALKEIASFSPALASELAKEHGLEWPNATEH